METKLYYFSSTGNSLYAARKLAEGLGGAEIIPMALETRKASILLEAGILGFVTPMYFLGWPALVRDFVERAELLGTEYVFLAYTAGGPAMESIVAQFRAALSRKGIGLDAAFGIKMIDSYALKYEVRKESPETKAALDATLSRIAAAVRERRSIPRFRLSLPPSWISEPWLAKLPSQDRSFAAGESCNGCGTCARACPVGNIALVEGKPAWQGRCQLCLACLHACPRTAIEHGEATRGKGRYRKEGIALGDLLLG